MENSIGFSSPRPMNVIYLQDLTIQRLNSWNQKFQLNSFLKFHDLILINMSPLKTNH